jgi:thiamine-monophosphate kinase
MMGEFELIERFFSRPSPTAVLGVGDDCALLALRAGMQLAISSDMLVSGRHFFADVDPFTLGHKALAVNLSDLAACGARPLAFTLALALPEARESWLLPFSRGMLALADAHDCELIGGDTTKGPLTISITVFGEVPPARALLRSGAVPKDDIYVSGHLGDARLALDALMGVQQLAPALLEPARQRLELPQARIALGLALRGVASAAIDVSDGLLGDLGHILQSSGVGATVQTGAAPALLGAWANPASVRLACVPALDAPRATQLVFAGGDDYELVFTAPPAQRAAVQAAAQDSATPVTRIGQVDAESGLRLVDDAGHAVANTFSSFDHFA